MSLIFKMFITSAFVTLLKIKMINLTEISFYQMNNTVWLQEYHRIVLFNYFGSRENWLTSNLGSILLKNTKYPPVDPDRLNKTYDIIIWEHETNVAEIKRSLEKCRVQNCIFHNNSFPIGKSEAVLIDVWNKKILPSQRDRSYKQKWIFYTLESPKTLSINTRNFQRFSYSRFNWSMTYRTDSDIPVPYGRTLPKLYDVLYNSYKLLSNLVPYWEKKTKTVLVAAMISNCGVRYRLDFIKELKKYMIVDFYGKCGDLDITICRDDREKQCIYLKKYHFFLALENTLCRQYITEKVFYNAYFNGAIPIIVGAPKSDCEKLLPPQSYIHIDSFPTIADLAKEIIKLSENDDKLLSYHVWRAHFETTSESGYFGLTTSHYCRVCEALNYNSMSESYYNMDDLLMFLEPKLLCDSFNTMPRWKSVKFTAN